MRILEVLAGHGLATLGLAIFIGLVGAYAAGIGLGRMRRARGKAAKDAASFVTNGLLGLLAFTLGLTIAMAQGRFEDRRRATLDEANAIGTAWLRAGAIGHARGAEIARLLEEYAQVRVAFLLADHGSPAIATANAETSRLQALIWGHSAALVRERGDAVANALQASLNETFDLATTMRWAFAAPLPGELTLLLLGMSVLAIGAMGYQFGLTGAGSMALALLLLTAWTASMVVVADLSTGRLGAVRPDPAPYLWTIEGFHGGIAIPPPP